MEEARVEPIAMVMERRRLEWFGHLERRMKHITAEQSGIEDGLDAP